MSDLLAVLDAAVVKAATVTGLMGASDGGLMEIPSTPWALVYVNAGSAVQSGLMTLADELEIRVYIPKTALPPAYRALLPFPDRFETVWRTDRDLGGTCLDSWYAGHGKVELESWGGIDYLFLPIRIGVLRTAAADLSP